MGCRTDHFTGDDDDDDSDDDDDDDDDDVLKHGVGCRDRPCHWC